MSDNFLPYFITEEIFPIKESTKDLTDKKLEEGIRSEPEPISKNEPQKRQEPIPIHHNLIVVTGEINDQDKALLMNVLGAVKVNTNTTLIQPEAPESHITYSRMLIFTSHPTHPYYQTIKSDKGEVLHSKPLPVLDSDRNEKVALWNALKAWFNL